MRIVAVGSRLSTAALAFVALSLSAHITAQSRSEVLHCKPGQHTVLILTPTLEGTQIDVGFKKSDQPASSSLEPGACAWSDRAMDAGDPIVFKHFAEGFFVRVMLSEHFSSYQPVRFAEPDEFSDAMDRELRYLLDAIREERDFVVHVEPRGSEGLFVTRIGP